VVCSTWLAVWSLPLLLFPAHVEGVSSSTSSDGSKNVLGNIKGLPPQLMH